MKITESYINYRKSKKQNESSKSRRLQQDLNDTEKALSTDPDKIRQFTHKENDKIYILFRKQEVHNESLE